MLSDEKLAELEPACQEIAKLADEHPDSVCIDQTVEGWRSSVEAHGQVQFCSGYHSSILEALADLKQKIIDKEQFKD